MNTNEIAWNRLDNSIKEDICKNIIELSYFSSFKVHNADSNIERALQMILRRYARTEYQNIIKNLASLHNIKIDALSFDSGRDIGQFYCEMTLNNGQNLGNTYENDKHVPVTISVTLDCRSFIPCDIFMGYYINGTKYSDLNRDMAEVNPNDVDNLWYQFNRFGGVITHDNSEKMEYKQMWADAITDFSNFCEDLENELKTLYYSDMAQICREALDDYNPVVELDDDGYFEHMS